MHKQWKTNHDAHAERMESNANVGQVVEDFDVVAFEHLIGDVIELGNDGRLEIRLGLVEELRIEIEIDLQRHNDNK